MSLGTKIVSYWESGKKVIPAVAAAAAKQKKGKKKKAYASVVARKQSERLFSSYDTLRLWGVWWGG